jgi:hypothetical protein
MTVLIQVCASYYNKGSVIDYNEKILNYLGLVDELPTGIFKLHNIMMHLEAASVILS